MYLGTSCMQLLAESAGKILNPDCHNDLLVVVILMVLWDQLAPHSMPVCDDFTFHSCQYNISHVTIIIIGVAVPGITLMYSLFHLLSILDLRSICPSHGWKYPSTKDGRLSCSIDWTDWSWPISLGAAIVRAFEWFKPATPVRLQLSANYKLLDPEKTVPYQYEVSEYCIYLSLIFCHNLLTCSNAGQYIAWFARGYHF